MARDGMKVCCRVLKESNKVGLTANSVMNVSFGIVAGVYFLPKTFLEIAVYSMTTMQFNRVSTGRKLAN